MQEKAESVKNLTLKCWQAEDDVIDALGTLAAWLGLVQEPFPTPSQYQSLLDSIRDDKALVKEFEEIMGQRWKSVMAMIQQLIGSLQADEMDGLRVEDVSMVDCLLENAPILDSLVSKVSTSLLSLTKSEMDGVVVAARMLHVDDYG
eukprot:jgi/Picre1/35482/NNA_002944.t1